MYTSDTAANSGSCRYGTFTYSYMFVYLDMLEHITGWKKCLFMHSVHFDLSALLSVAIHPIQFILPPQPPFVSGSDDLCEKNNPHWYTGEYQKC